jgi:hypothetical protein
VRPKPHHAYSPKKWLDMEPLYLDLKDDLKKMISKWVEIGSFIFKISQFINPKQNYITLQQTLNIYKSKDLLADLKLNTQNRSLSAI